MNTFLIPDWPAPAGVRACVTTRAGGVSVAPFDSFNLGDHVGDDPVAVAHNRHALALLAVTADGRVDLAPGGDDTDNDALIDTADTAALQLGNQLRLRLDGLGDHHQSGGVFVQAMHDPRTRHINNVRYVVQQRIEQSAISMPRSRVHHQTRGFVDDQDVIVFVNDVEGNVLGDPLTLGFLLCSQLQDGATMHDVTGTYDVSVHSEAAVFDPGGKARARVLSE